MKLVRLNQMMTRVKPITPTLKLNLRLQFWIQVLWLQWWVRTCEGNKEGSNDTAERTSEIDKGVILKNSMLFTDCISEINNTQIDNEKCLDIVMPM